jgi:hypothetical protein
MYRVATRLVQDARGDPSTLSDGIGVLLLTWNGAHYRYGPFDFGRFESFLKRHRPILDDLRNRHIQSFEPSDNRRVTFLFS